MNASAAGYVAVIPAYNEVRTIRDIASRTRLQLERVIVIDDASSDGTAAQLSGASIEVIRNQRNLGKGASLWRGIDAALASDIAGVVTLDADGQHLPEDIPRLIEAARRYPDQIVIGSRLHDSAPIPPSRYLANRFANFWIAWAAGYPIIDSQSGLRLYPANLLRSLPATLREAGSFVFESEVLIEAANLGVHAVFVPIAAVYQAHARPSHFHGVRDIWHITRMIARHLIRKRMYISGLIRSLRGSAIRLENSGSATPAGAPKSQHEKH